VTIIYKKYFVSFDQKFNFTVHVQWQRPWCSSHPHPSFCACTRIPSVQAVRMHLCLLIQRGYTKRVSFMEMTVLVVLCHIILVSDLSWGFNLVLLCYLLL